MSKYKRIVPFSNGTEAMDWMDHNCDVCKTRYGCAGKKNIELGFVLGDISEKSAKLIGMTNGHINDHCQMRNKRKKWNEMQRELIDDKSLLF